MKRLWMWSVLALLAAGCATTGGRTTSSGTATRPSGTSRPPAYFDLAVPTAVRGEYRVYRFDRIRQQLTRLRTVSTTDSVTHLRQFVAVVQETPISIVISHGGTVTPSWQPQPPPPPPTGDGLWTVPPREMALAREKLAAEEPTAPTTVLVGDIAVTAP